ncbi:hypothetical protein TNCV_1790341 [Trichonephila clavipes]|nr:hypothetical protein TNCV_1790341 [Trichonephila clavipes]
MAKMPSPPRGCKSALRWRARQKKALSFLERCIRGEEANFLTPLTDDVSALVGLQKEHEELSAQQEQTLGL